MEKAFVIFSGGNDRAIIGFLRALRLCGKHAHIVARTSADKVLKTRYRRDVRWIRLDDTLSLQVFSDCIKHVQEYSGAKPLVVLPSTEYFNTFLLQNRREIEQMGCEIPLVLAGLYKQLTNKHTATNFFAEAGISSPKEVDDMSLAIPPLVAKPLHNICPSGKSLYPHLLTTRSLLEAFEHNNNPSDFFYQEYVRGESIYLLFYLPRTSKEEFIWSQRNLMQQPDGKSMLLTQASDFHKTQSARRILDALRQAGFHGLGMVEIIRSSERDVFIEMNPRIWGPVQYCLDEQQPLLQAFIGDCLHDDPNRYIHSVGTRKRHRYFWFGGLATTIGTRKQPAWHATRHTLAAVTLRNIMNDVYLRGDSWRCFISELADAFNMRWKSERPKN